MLVLPRLGRVKDTFTLATAGGTLITEKLIGPKSIDDVDWQILYGEFRHTMSAAVANRLVRYDIADDAQGNPKYLQELYYNTPVVGSASGVFQLGFGAPSASAATGTAFTRMPPDGLWLPPGVGVLLAIPTNGQAGDRFDYNLVIRKWPRVIKVSV